MSIFKKIHDKGVKNWTLFYLLFSINFTVILTMLLMLNEFWGDINLNVSNYIGVYINIVLIILIIILGFISYGAILFTINIKKATKEEEPQPHKLNKIVPIILLIIFDVFFILVFYLYKQYTILIPQVSEFYSLILAPIVCIILIIMAYPLLKVLPQLKDRLTKNRMTPERKASIILLLISATYIIAFISPILYVPANVIYEDMPDKPSIFTHRGASKLAPENTIIAGEVAIEYDAIGWEVDIRISKDGIPFLMHDNTLTRTTDVEEVFPNRKNDLADSFKWEEIQELDAGSWFVDLDPYGSIARGLISKEDAEKYRGEKIPSFEEMLNFSRENDLLIDFDTKGVSEDHKYYDDYFENLINLTLKSGINLKNVMVATNNEDWIDLIEEKNATDIRLAMDMGTNPTAEQYENSEYNLDFIKTGDEYSNYRYRELHNADIPVLVYTIDSIERYSELWCLGVKWVMTNDPLKFEDLEAPVLYIHLEMYLTIWILMYVSLITIIIVIKFVLMRKK